MAASPRFKVYIGREYVAACKRAEDAAAVLALYGSQAATIRHDHGLVVWREGGDGHAADSFDAVADLVWRRVREMRRIWAEEIRRPGQADVDTIRPA